MNSIISRKISCFSFVYACCVVYFHFNNYVSGTDIFTNGFILFIKNWLDYSALFANHFFFILSAYLLFYNIDERNWKNKIKRRLVSLGIPYLFFETVYLVLTCGPIYKYDLFSIVQGYLTSYYCNQFWFVLELLLLLTMVWPIMKTKNHTLAGGLVLVILLLLSINGYSFIPWERLGSNSYGTFGYTLKRFTDYFLSYYLGAFIGLHFKIDYLQGRSNSRMVRIASTIAFLCPIFMSYFFPNVSGVWGGMIYKIFVILHPVFLWIIIPDSLFDGAKRIVELFFNCSFMVYALHMLVYYFINKLVTKTGVLGMVDWKSISYDRILPFRIIVGTTCIFICVVMILATPGQQSCNIRTRFLN